MTCIAVFGLSLLILQASPSFHGVPEATPEAIGGHQTWFEDQKLYASDGREDAEYGDAVSIDGDVAIIGAPYDDELAWASGAAYVYEREGTTWTERIRLTVPDNWYYCLFGRSVAVDGDTALVGAPRYTTQGSVFVYVRSGSTWTQQARLWAPSPASYLGFSVSLDGDTALVGAPFEEPTGHRLGAAYVFTRTGTTWSAPVRLTPLDPRDWAYVGISVAIDGDTALVGADQDSGVAWGAGAAYVFTRSGTSWTQQARLTASDGDEYDYYGGSVSVDGDTALVGARSAHDLAGGAYVYVRAGTVWSEQAALLPPPTTDWLAFGCSVSLVGNTALVGAWGNDEPVTNVGAVYEYVRSGTSWTQQTKLIPWDAPEYAFFGSTVSSDGESILVGAPWDDVLVENSGSAYVFTARPSASATFRNDTGGTNSTGFFANAPVLGEDWIATVDNTGTGNFLAGVFGYGNPLELYLPRTDDWLLVDPLSPWGELLRLSPAYGYGVVTFTVPIPGVLSLVGFTMSTQGGGMGGAGGTTLHNAYDLFLGY